jgi:phosphotransferase system enzyme I (PtsI)
MVAHLYDPLHPAVLNLLAGIIGAADKAKVPVALCGEMAGDTALTRLLLAFGLRQYSMHTAHLLDVKQVILRSNCAQLKALGRKMLRASEPDRLRALLAELNSR